MNLRMPPAIMLTALAVTLLNFSLTYSQVGINTVSPDSGSALDVDTSDKGILIPRVNITNLGDIAPITGSSTESLMVYNTNTTTGKGFYYWDGSSWVNMSGNDWKLKGNANTHPGVDSGIDDFIGTSDDTDLYIARNRVEQITIFDDEIVINNEDLDINFRVATNNDSNALFIDAANDNIGIGVDTPATSTKLEVYNPSADAVSGYSDNVGGVLGRETNISFGTPVQTISGAGVYANNPNSGYTSMFAQSTGNADVGALGSYSDVWIAGYDYVDNARDTYNPPASYSQLNVTSSVLPGYKAAIRAYTNRGATTGNPGYTVGIQSTAVADNEDGFGISAGYFGNSSYAAGGEFFRASSGGISTAYALVAADLSGTTYKIVGYGAVSTIVTDESEQERIMFAPEAPEVTLQDSGIGELRSGVAQIQIDPVLAKNIVVDANHPLKVFVTLEGDCNGVFVTEKSANGFTVKELQGGTSNTPFSWQIIASRADERDSSGRTISKYQDQRFPVFERGNLKTPRSNGRMVMEKKTQNFTRE